MAPDLEAPDLPLPVPEAQQLLAVPGLSALDLKSPAVEVVPVVPVVE